MKSFITQPTLESENTILYMLTCLRRWSEVVLEPGKYTELGKQAFNNAIAYFWGIEAKHLGANVDLTDFPKIALFRAYAKTMQCDVAQFNIDRILKLGNLDPNVFLDFIKDQIEQSTSKNFLDFLYVPPDALSYSIFNGATKIATLLELESIKSGISKRDYKIKHKQICSDLKKYSDLPGYKKILSKKYLQIFQNYSQLRNRVRWATRPNLVKCGVLGHLFDVAVFAYLMSLETHAFDETLATRYFFMGLFHDFPEKWTGDMPSPIKDAIPGLREATELFENEVMQLNVYSKLPDYQVKALRSVMLEDEGNVQYKKFLKLADNFSANVECWRELNAPFNDYYISVLKNGYECRDKLPQKFRFLAEKMYETVRT